MENNKPPVFQNPQSDGSTFLWEGKPGNHVAVLLFHGFTATTVEVRPFAKFFHELGYTVAGTLLPGHGVSPDDLNQTKYSDWIKAADKAYNDLKTRNFQQIFVVGESMGGLLSLWLSILHPEITGLLIFAPALKVHGLWQANLFWPFMKYKFKTNIDLSSPWQGFTVVPLHAASQLFRLQLKIKNNLAKIKTPMVIFQGKLDKTIDPLGAVDVLERSSSTKKELVWLEESSHCILLDKQMTEVQQLSLDFIKDLSGTS